MGSVPLPSHKLAVLTPMQHQTTKEGGLATQAPAKEGPATQGAATDGLLALLACWLALLEQ